MTYRTKSIEAMEPGDLVLAIPEDDPTAPTRLGPVVEMYRRTSDHFRVLTIRDR